MRNLQALALTICAAFCSGVFAVEVGTTAGELSVSPTGSANYSIPISVPPGIGGMAPSLSIQYDSMAGDGLLGRGGSLGGLSQITRCNRNRADDGYMKAIEFNETDAFCLDNQRLVAVAGIYGAVGTEYRTQIDSFSKVVSYGGTLGDPQYWKVWTKSGLVMEFGNTVDSRIEAGGRSNALFWAMNRTEDSVGNAMTVGYDEYSMASHFLPRSITYAGGRARVDIDYEYRSDPSFRYIGGSYVRNEYRVKKISTYTAGVYTREYRMGYNAPAQSGGSATVSLLTSVTECDPRSGNCFNPTRFNWDAIPFVGTTLGAGHYVSSSNAAAARDISRLGYGDFNGDGRTDVYRLDSSSNTQPITIVTYRADGGHDYSQGPSVYISGNAEQVNKDIGRVKAADLDGNGTTDFLIINVTNTNTPVSIYRKTATGFTSATSGPSHYVDSDAERGKNDVDRFRVLDLNGDGLPDIHVANIGRDPQNSSIAAPAASTIYYNQGSGVFGSAQPGPSFLIGRDYSNYGGDGVNPEAVAFDLARIRYGDFNGDGMTDIYVMEGCMADTPSTIWFNSQNGFTRTVSTNFKHYANCYDNDRKRRLADLGRAIQGDFNGDGMTDFFVVTSRDNTNPSEILYSRGNGTFNIQKSLPFYVGESSDALKLDLNRIKVADLNGDGLTDILYLNGYGNPEASLIYVNRGWGAFQQVTGPSYFITDNLEKGNVDASRMTLTDVNGDGVQEMYYLRGSGSDPWTQLLHLPLTPNERIQTITNGLGAATQISYRPLTDDSIYTRVSYALPKIAIQGAVYVTSLVTNPDGLGGTRQVEHSYSGAAMDLQGRGFLGFQTHAEFDHGSRMRQVTTYRQDFPFIGMPSASVTTTESGALISEELISYSSRNITANGVIRYFPYVSTQIERNYELNSPGTATHSEATVNTYGEPDSAFFGNLTASNTKIREGLESSGITPFVTTTTNTYTNDVSLWILGRLTRAVVVKSSPSQPSITRTSAFEYDSTTGLMTAEVVEPDSSTAMMRKSLLRDANGNIYSTTISGSDIAARTNTTGFDSAQQFPISVTNALGQSSTMVHDPATGNVTRSVDANGLVTTWQFDGLGRKKLEKRPDNSTTTWTRAWGTGHFAIANGIYTISSTSSDGSTGAVVNDVLERPIATEKLRGDSNYNRVLTTYDTAGRIKSRTLPFFEANPTCSETSTYDAIGRPLTMASPNGDTACSSRVTQYQYGVRTSTVTDPMGRSTAQEVDPRGAVIHTTDAKGVSTNFAYDAYGNQTRISHYSKPATTMQYDTRGRKFAMVDPDMGAWSYAYNALGELKRQTDAKNQAVTFDYDVLGRMIARQEPEGTSRWWHDNDSTGQKCWIGALCESINSTGRAHKFYRYDALGRVSSETSTLVGQLTEPAANAIPAPPANPSPSDTVSPGATTASANVTLRWSKSTRATAYTVKIYKSNGLKVSDVSVTGTSYSVSLAADTIHYWTVNACNATGCSTETSARYFRTNAMPTVPTTLSPGNATSPGPTTASAIVKLTWAGSNGATSFQLKVYQSDGVLVESLTTSSPTYDTYLTGTSAYYWTVRACTAAACSADAAFRYFRTPAPPAAPEALSPGDTAAPGPVMTNKKITFSWSASSGATSYTFRLYSPNGTGGAYYDTTSTSITVSIPASNTDYAWQVKACSYSGCSDYSASRYFRIFAVFITDLCGPNKSPVDCIVAVVEPSTGPDLAVASALPNPNSAPLTCPVPDMACMAQLSASTSTSGANPLFPYAELPPSLISATSSVSPCPAPDLTCYQQWLAAGMPSSSSMSTPAAEQEFLSLALNTNAAIADGPRHTLVTSLTYDTQSRVSKTLYGDYLSVGYSYDAQGYLRSVTNGSSQTLWLAETRDARNNVTAYTQGEVIRTSRAYGQSTGELYNIDSRYTSPQSGNVQIQLVRFDRDLTGQITYKNDSRSSVNSEQFEYDELHRLKSNRVNNIVQDSYQYNDYGNITYRSSIGRYNYNATTRPHAVSSITEASATAPIEYRQGQAFQYDANGNLLSAGGRTYAWTSFNKPRLISLGAESSSFDYDASRERVFELQNRVLNGAQQVTEIFTAGGYERRINADGSTEDRVYVTAGGLPVALLTRAGVETATPDGGAGATIRYLHTDHQGSVEAVSGFIDGVFRIVDRMSYDPYGARRLPNGTADTSHSEEKRAHPADRGYTGHHQLDHLQLIHMNGRVYDPYLGRFISADPFIQDPYSSQSLNRYSYVWNNPVNGTDPSGYFLKGLYRGGKNFLQDNRRLIYSVAITAAGGWVVAPLAGASLVAGSAYVGFTAGLVGSGGDLKAAAIGGITAGAFAGVGNVYAQNPGGLLGGGHTGMLVEKTIAHGVVGGTSSVLAGGKFGAGFLSAAVPAGYRNAGFGGQLGSLRGYAEAAILGGTASELGGGKFANGAITATMAYALNDVLHYDGKKLSWRNDDGKTIQEWDAVSGRDGYQDPAFQGLADKGPIPEGAYDVKQSELQFIGNRSALATVAAEAGFTAWPGGESSWGQSRVWLSPASGTNTLGRSGFSVHGGSYPGSAGCIDLTSNMPSFTSRVQSYGRDLRLTVKY